MAEMTRDTGTPMVAAVSRSVRNVVLDSTVHHAPEQGLFAWLHHWHSPPLSLNFPIMQNFRFTTALNTTTEHE